jgi:OFA family oxalate/formate antiporter-like MFS transporter
VRVTVSEDREAVAAVGAVVGTAGPAPSRLGEIIKEFRHGWLVVLAGTIGTSVSVLTATYALAIQMGPLETAFGWTRSEVAVASSFFTVGLFLAGPWFGKLYDRYGIRRVGPPAVILLALTYAGITQVRGDVWVLYAGYLCLGLLGAGTSYVAYSRAVNTWFDKGRGVALAITMAGTAIAASVQPLVLPGLIAQHGWQAGYLALSVSALIALPLLWFVIREKPRAQANDGGERASLPGVPAKTALKSVPFWLMAGGIFLVGISLVGLHLHLMPMLRDRGAAPAEAAQVFALMGVGVLAGRFISGALLDSFRGAWVAAFLFSFPPVAWIGFSLFGMPFAPVMAVMLGIATGAEADALGYLCSRYFGMKSYSEIFGWLYGAMALGSACGPILTGTLYDRFGGYGACLVASTLMCSVAVGLFLILARYPYLRSTTAER